MQFYLGFQQVLFLGDFSDEKRTNIFTNDNYIYNFKVDYINLYTPYRGLLIYHGLGAGKTCASIAIMEGIKSFKKVIIMTPAS